MASQDNQVLELLEKAKKELEALEAIKFRTNLLLILFISMWEEDIENKVKVLKNKKRKALLNTTIASLDNLMSKELKDEIELQRIINLLANG